MLTEHSLAFVRILLYELFNTASVNYFAVDNCLRFILVSSPYCISNGGIVGTTTYIKRLPADPNQQKLVDVVIHTNARSVSKKGPQPIEMLEQEETDTM